MKWRFPPANAPQEAFGGQARVSAPAHVLDALRTLQGFAATPPPLDPADAAQYTADAESVVKLAATRLRPRRPA